MSEMLAASFAAAAEEKLQSLSDSGWGPSPSWQVTTATVQDQSSMFFRWANCIFADK